MLHILDGEGPVAVSAAVLHAVIARVADVCYLAVRVGVDHALRDRGAALLVATVLRPPGTRGAHCVTSSMMSIVMRRISMRYSMGTLLRSFLPCRRASALVGMVNGDCLAILPSTRCTTRMAYMLRERGCSRGLLGSTCRSSR